MMSHGPRLSICIPTYNRGEYIGDTLESIAAQVTPDVEVVVSDNASSDDTRAAVEAFRARLPRLVYWRNDENEGFSRNFMRAVDLASGDYCWLLGSDDVVCDGMLERVLAELGSAHAAYVFDRLEWDAKANRRWLDAVLDPRYGRDTFRLGNREVLLDYLHSSRSITAMFSFISSTVFLREAWLAVPMRTSWYDCAFPHAMRIFGMFYGDRTLRYVREPLVLNRLGNDTFNPGGIQTIRRLLMDYDGYRRIIEQYWRDDPVVASAAKTVMRRTHTAVGVLKFRRIVRPDQLASVCASLAYFEYGRVLVWFYGTEACRLMIVGSKLAHQLLVRSRTRTLAGSA
jgi:abequosyltransferase